MSDIAFGKGAPNERLQEAKNEMNPDEAAGSPDMGAPKILVSLPSELQGSIGRQLKHVYGQMLAEPMPDKFAQLLESLSKSDYKS